MNRLLLWLTGFLPCRIINDGETPYLERYYLGTLLGWRFYLHHFVGSDPDRGLHDHPWRRAFSLVLSGWYWEETRTGTRKVTRFNSLTGDTFHRVVLPENYIDNPQLAEKHDVDFYLALRPSPCWTLFMHTAENVKPWGFWRSAEWDSGKGATFQEYTYTREGNQRDWWLTAPKGREVRQ